MKRILAVEDSATQGEQLCAVLDGAGLDVVLARSGEDALRLMETETFDLVLSDVVMPGIDGYELCRRIKQLVPDIPLILMTSLTDPFEVVHGLEAGADNFLHKPYDADQLVGRIRAMLHNAEMRSCGHTQMGLEIFFLGQRFMITADRQQMLDLLVSTFEDLVATHREVSERSMQLVDAHAELAVQLEAVEHERRRLNAVLAAVPDTMVIVDGRGVITGANDAASRLLETPVEALIDRHASEVARFVDADGKPVDPASRPLAATLARLEACEAGGAFDLFLVPPGRSRVPVIARGAPVRDHAGHVIGAVGLLHEIGGLASHDPVTGLPDHSLFVGHVENASVRAAERENATAVLVIALDRFERIRELGPVANDIVAKMGRRLQASLKAAASVTGPIPPYAAYLGGEQFAVVLPEVENELTPIRVAHLIAEELGAPLSAEGVELRVTTSIGVAMSTDRVGSAVELVAAAAAASRRASSSGGARCELFDATMNIRATQRLEAEAELRDAINSEQLVVHYQPEIDLATGGVVGAEALVRWNHRRRGLVPPGEFIPLAEETGLIIPLGWWVLEEACRQAAKWRSEPSAEAFTMSVNVSVVQLSEPDAIQRIQHALHNAGLAPDGLLLEITETGLMAEGPHVTRCLNELRELGIKLCIDDFGTGYSSLIQLRRLPVHALKIDRTFVNGMTNAAEDTAIVDSTVRLAHALGLEVVAEGVGSEDHLTILRALDCDLAQGHFWSPALPPAVFETWMKRGASSYAGESPVK